MKIKQGYVRKTDAKEETKTASTQKCPHCKAEINKAEWRAHFRVCVLDSKWKDNKQKNQERAGGMSQLASGEEITQNLKRLANQRPDLAGKPISDLEIKEKPAQPQPTQTIWDGQSSNITRTTANIAMLRAQQ
jgi:hypothetical protein